MMMKCIAIILALFISTFCFSQEEDTYVYGDSAPKTNTKGASKKGGFDWSKVTIGGGLGLQFGGNTVISVAPTLGYYVTENFVVGFGLNYTYEKNTIFFPAYTASTYGGNVYAQYLFSNMPLIAHAELESANISVDYSDNIYESVNLNLINVYVGGGIKQRIGSNSYLYALALWNLNETRESNYVQTNPILRIGIAIGL